MKRNELKNAIKTAAKKTIKHEPWGKINEWIDKEYQQVIDEGKTA